VYNIKEVHFERKVYLSGNFIVNSLMGFFVNLKIIPFPQKQINVSDSW